MSTSHPPDVIHVIGVPKPYPVFVLFRFHVLYWTQTEARGGLKRVCLQYVHKPGKEWEEKVFGSFKRKESYDCVCAAGFSLPLFMMCPRKRITEALKVGAYPDTSFNCSDNGWISQELHIEWSFWRPFLPLNQYSWLKMVIRPTFQYRSIKLACKKQCPSSSSTITYHMHSPYSSHLM